MILRIGFFVNVVASTSLFASANSKVTELEAKRERYSCGARAVFALSRLLGEDVEYSDVCDQFTFSDKGSSLANVRDALLSHNVPCSTHRLELTELRLLPVPFIAHVAQVREGSIDDGHYLIVTGVEEDGVQTYDPQYNKTRHYQWRIFSDRWYGYVIVPRHVSNWNSDLVTIVVGINIFMVLGIAVSLGRNMWPLLANRSAVAAIFVASALGLWHPADARAGELIRSAPASGANAAALLGGLYGVELPPGHVEGTARIESLGDVQSQLQAYGLTASVRSLSYDALTSGNRPCVVPMTGAATTAGVEEASFCVFLKSYESDVYLVAAGPLMVREVSVDEFRRYWTGYAVFCDIGCDAQQRGLLAWALFYFGVPLFGYRIFAYLRSRIAAWHPSPLVCGETSSPSEKLVRNGMALTIHVRDYMKLLTIPFCATLFAASAKGDDSLPPNVQVALKKNAAFLSNIYIAGDRSRRFLAPAETVLKTFRTLESEAAFTQSLRFEVRFQGSQFRESIEYPPGVSNNSEKLLETSFDGETFRTGYKNLRKPSSSSLYIRIPAEAAKYAREHDEPRMFNKMEFWYLFEAGLIGPQTMHELGEPVASMVLKAAERQEIASVSEVAGENGAMLEVVIEQPEPWQSLETFDIEKHEEYLSMSDGSQNLQMRVERERRQLLGKHRVIRLRLNVAFGYAVEEKWISRKETGETMFHTKNSRFVQVGSDGVWMPKRCVVASHAYWTSPLLISPDPLYETEIRMERCVLGNFDEEQFRIWYDTPGALITDFRVKIGDAKEPDIYRVPASVEDLVIKVPGYRRWLIILNILAIAGLLGWWWRMRSMEA
jgi:predicted double-glycine peptidase